MAMDRRHFIRSATEALAFSVLPGVMVALEERGSDRVETRRYWEQFRQKCGDVRKNHGIELSYGTRKNFLGYEGEVERHDMSETDLKQMIAVAGKLDTSLGEIYPPLLSGVDSIRIFAAKSIGGRVTHTNPSEILLKYSDSEAHAEQFDRYLNGLKGLVAHESAHSKELQTPGFYGEWKEFIGDVNFRCTFLTVASEEHCMEGPEDGFVNRIYGTQPCMICIGGEPVYHEDVATYVDHVYQPGFGFFRDADPSDSRYKSKLGLLRKNDFISKEQFEGTLTAIGANIVPVVSENQ